ncbi:hypothetical protein SIID45300_01065 [Candidatus Magnetaquicoccaceae bacterium FCR-1]|uniref:Major tail protein n=1 Tax=Candidatus Magnetaquiglobus chichijimensis TaxID=3141448 RepID=A0ABQ0C790_9PROT
MAIANTDISYRKSITVNDSASNGGLMGFASSLITNNVAENVWPHIPEAERLAGSTRYRKIFVRIAPATTTKASNTRLFLDKHTPGDDRILLTWAGNLLASQTDTQAEAVGYTRFYGGADLAADASAGATSITVAVENPADAIFKNGDLIRISDKTTFNTTVGSEEFLRLASTNAVLWNGNTATLTFEPGTTLANAYTMTEGTRVQSVIEVGDVEPLVDGFVNNGSGTFDSLNYPINGTSKGTIEESWTLTFIGPGAYTVTGARVGVVGEGTVASTFAPSGTGGGSYFVIDALAWTTLSWTTGDTITFNTHPSAIGIWEKRIVPAGAAATAANGATLVCTLQSA